MIVFNAWKTWVWLSPMIDMISSLNSSISVQLKWNENKIYRGSKCGYHKHLSRKHLQLLEINKIIILECYFLEQNIHYVKWKRKNVLFILVEACLNYVLKLLLPKCFIVQKLSGWFYHTDGKRCGFCLTCGNKPLEIRTNDFTRIVTFEIILSHFCLFIWLCLRQDSKQFNKLWVTNFKKLCMTKKSHICSGINLFELHCWQFI